MDDARADRHGTGHRPAALQVHWLVRLRWAAVVAQIASILGVKYLLRAPFPLLPLALIVGALALANVALWALLRRGRGLSERAIAANLLLDSAALTGLLVWTGGAMNPFTTLYLLHVALAAILVSRRWSLVVAAGAVAAFGALLLARPEAVHVWHSAGMFVLHVRGMWFAFALTAGCLWFFVDRVSASLQQREGELAEARLEAERGRRLAALGTLAAGTAHELNTPLGTVAILSAELSDALAGDPVHRELADHIRAEVRRCKEILAKMRAHDLAPEDPLAVDPGEWTREVVTAWCASHAGASVPVRVSEAGRGGKVELRVEGMAQALTNLLDNAWLATGATGDGVSVEVNPRGRDHVAITVIDRGVGIPSEHLPRLGEPFFTTREPGHGMGLGLFLVQAAVALHRGALTIASEGGTTRVEVVLPCEAARREG